MMNENSLIHKKKKIQKKQKKRKYKKKSKKKKITKKSKKKENNKKNKKLKNNKKIFLLFKTHNITKMYQLNHNNYYDFIVDNRGDIWMKVYNGYLHRMYRIFSKRHPSNLSKEIEKKL